MAMLLCVSQPQIEGINHGNASVCIIAINRKHYPWQSECVYFLVIQIESITYGNPHMCTIQCYKEKELPVAILMCTISCHKQKALPMGILMCVLSSATIRKYINGNPHVCIIQCHKQKALPMAIIMCTIQCHTQKALPVAILVYVLSSATRKKHYPWQSLSVYHLVVCINTISV